MLTPMDIHNKEFKRGFRGYSEEDVDAFMDDLAADYEKCEKYEDKLSQYEKMESTMNQTLMLAQQTAENVKVSARKEADLILQEAENKKKQMLDATTLNVQTTQQDMDKMKTQMNTFRAKVRSILQSQLRLLDDMVLVTEAEENAAPAAVEAAPAVEAAEEAVADKVEE